MIRYSLRAADPDRHYFEVVCRLEDARARERFRFPSWIPGSYLMREFARLVVAVEASAGGVKTDVEKIDKRTWECGSIDGKLELRFTVYALDESVRGAYLDRTRAYFNGACVFAELDGRGHEPVELTIEPPAGEHDWRVATSMTAVDVDENGFGVYAAADYDELIDHPVEIGDFASVDFAAGGVPHHFVLAGRFDTDLERVGADLRQLCEAHIQFFGGDAPFDRYHFLALATGNAYGGLEHRAASSLIFNRDDLPPVGEPGIPVGYQRFLALCSHEYFHAWHVKRTRPAAMTPYRLGERNYTRSLWVFEGITSYYQEVLLLRSGLIGAAAFLRRIAEMLTRVYRSPGRKLQSIAQSSFDAWDVLYKPDANSPNAAISYYSKGGLVALALDLTLRMQHDSKVSLDTLVRELWERYGRNGTGVPEDGFESLAKQLGGDGLGKFFDLAVRGTADLPLEPLLAEFGVELVMRQSGGPADKGGTAKPPNAEPRVWLGASWRDANGGIELTSVLDGSPAQHGGLNPGDLLIAIDRLRVSGGNIAARLVRFEPGQAVVASVFRAGELREHTLVLEPAPLDTCVLSLDASPSRNAARLRQAWLGE